MCVTNVDELDSIPCGTSTTGATTENWVCNVQPWLRGRDPAQGEGIIDTKDIFSLFSFRTPAMIGCSFVVDREYFGQIGLLDPGMEVYGGENIELGMRVREETTPQTTYHHQHHQPPPFPVAFQKLLKNREMNYIPHF